MEFPWNCLDTMGPCKSRQEMRVKRCDSFKYRKLRALYLPSSNGPRRARRASRFRHYTPAVATLSSVSRVTESATFTNPTFETVA